MAGRKAKVVEGTPLEPYAGTLGDKMGQLQQLYQKWYGCQRCGLCQYRTAPDLVFGDGNPNSHLLIVGEGPGEEEERQGIPFIGNSGQLLNQILARVSDDVGIQELSDWYSKTSRSKKNVQDFNERVLEWRQKEFFTTNVVSCRPPENRTPTQPEMKACWERLWNIIYIVDPLLIVAVGKTALQAVMQKSQVEILKYRGKLMDTVQQGRVGPVKYPVIGTLHPSFLLRTADWKTRGGFFDKTLEDWMGAMTVLDKLRKDNYGIPTPQRVPLKKEG